MWVPLTLPLCVCPANPPPCPAHSVICLLAAAAAALALSLARSPQTSCFCPARARRMPSSEQAREARRPLASLSLPPLELFRSFAPHRIASHRMFLALRIAVISAVWPLLLLAMSCMPPSPRDKCESGHCGCCKPLRFLSRAALFLRLSVSVLLSVRMPAPAIHHHHH